MKAKTSTALFLALLFLSSPFGLRAQTDCYNIQCPSKITVPCEGRFGTHVSYSVTVANLCDPTVIPTVTYSIPPGSVFPPGTNVVCATVQIPGSVPRQCCFQVIVDNCCPTNCIDVICPRDVIVDCQQTSAGPGAFVNVPKPIATNYCGDHVVPSTLQFRCTPPILGNPTFFPPGTNHVVCCLTDGQKFMECCCFEVIVLGCPQPASDCKPRIECPIETQVSCTGQDGAVVFFPPLKISDPCGLVVGTNITHVSGSFFPNGKTTVAACIAYKDPVTGAIQWECCCFDVVVRCCQPTNCVSRLDCPTNIVIDCPPAGGTVLNYIVNGGNNCEPTTVVCNPPSGSVIYGPTNVCCKLVSANGNVLADCCFKVLVIDTKPPVIRCPDSITVVSSNCLPVPVPLPVIDAFDNCDPNPTVTCSPILHAYPCGITVVTCTATDSAGNTTNCSFSIKVICDGGPTQIICPPDITVACASPTGVVVTYSVIVSNRCDPTLRAVCNPPSGSVFLPGSYAVCCRLANDPATTTNACCFKVTVLVDDVPPTINCPSNIFVLTPNCVPINVDYPLPGATDNCQLVSVGCRPPPGSLFPIGITPVLCCAVDKAGNSNCCSFKITVRCPSNDCVQVYCPSNITVGCAGPNGAVVDFKAYATNICTGGEVPVICTPASGSTFPLGITQVCCTNVVTAANNQIGFCCFQVIVRPDTTPPEIRCPSNIVVISQNCTAIDVLYPLAVATDNCQLDSVICKPPSGSVFPPGVTTVTCCAFDKAGNSNCCSFTVTVRCPTDCVRVVCPSNIFVNCAGPNGAIVDYKAYATNVCTGGQLPLLCSPPSGSVFPIGVTTVCCTNAPAGSIGGAVCCFQVTVRNDTIPPTIICPSNIVVSSPNCVPIEVVYPAPIASDDCQLDSVACRPPSGSLFTIGVTPVVCCASDKSGNTNCCTFTVTVRCPSNCVQTVCPSNIVINCAGPNGAVAEYKPYVTNICTGTSVPLVCTPPSGSVFPIGISTVCCTNGPVGTTGNAICCFQVIVRPDTTPPTILCPSNIVVGSPNCAPIQVVYPAPVASDNCQLDSVTCKPASGSLFPVGITTVTCCAVDKARNTNCCSFTVTVRCPTDCIRLVCPSNVVTECAGPNGAVVNYNAYASNFCTGGIMPVTCSRPSGSFFPIGVTTVCCTNTAALPQWCCFDVIVKPDTKPPVINCPTNIYILCARPIGAKVEYAITASDNCDPAPAITCVPPSGSLFKLGCTNVVCTAVDRAGNASTCTFKVCVLPRGCYLVNPSFEAVVPHAPPPNNCGDPIGLAIGWSALLGTPDLFRPPFASINPGNCRGQERPCQGTNYAGLEGGYTSSGGFVTEAMMGTLVAPLNNNGKFRLRACLSLAESSTGPVLVEFVLANSANLAQQQVIHQVWVTLKNGWMQYQPPCFAVPQLGTWDRLIIRMAQVSPLTHPYQLGYAYVDNVNICCCTPVLHDVVLTSTGVTVTWEGRGQLQACPIVTDETGWKNIDSIVETDPDTGESRTTFPRPAGGPLFFRVVGPDDAPVDCAECGTGG